MKNFVVTASTKGIGWSVAKSLFEKYPDCKVFISYSHDEITAQDIKTYCYNKSFNVALTKVDLSDYNKVISYCDFIKSSINSLDGLILNVGVGYRVDFVELDFLKWENVLRTNVTLPLFMIKELLYLLASNNGVVIFTGSLMGDVPHSGSLAYGVSKSAVHGMVKNLVKFLSPYKIRVNAVAPGFTETYWHKDKPKEFLERISNKIAVHRWANADEIADAYIFLLENLYMNGEVLHINGGYNYF